MRSVTIVISRRHTSRGWAVAARRRRSETARVAHRTATGFPRPHVAHAIAGEILTAVKTGDTAAYQDANERWYANAHDIAVFLSRTLDPPLGTLADMDQMMRDHLDRTTDEVVARHNGDWTADVAAYDKVHAKVLEMADMLSDAIIANFPNKFRP